MTNPTRSPVVIVGGGLAGLLAARRLHRAGVPFQLLEARSRLGGRILSVDEAGTPSGDGFDLGPSWFWPGTQPALGALVAELGLDAFPQNTVGDVVIDRQRSEQPQRYRMSFEQAPPSMRLVGGSAALVARLAAELPATRLRTGARVSRIVRDADCISVLFLTAAGLEETIQASHVILALPPRLVEANLAFAPPLRAATRARWRSTPTWMAPHAKFFAVYETPFWREAGLSGMAQSMVGPLAEIHDATTATGRAALFGFLGVPAAARETAGEAAIKVACIQQLTRLFGPRAAAPRATLYKDWAADPLTATDADLVAGGHPVVAGQHEVDEAWRDAISLAGSEAALSEPGYLAGAVVAAERAVAALISKHRGSPTAPIGQLVTEAPR